MFINPSEKVAVKHGEDTVWVKAKMGLGTMAAVQNELVSIKIDFSQGQDMTNADLRIGQRQQELVLLKHNIVDWDGPSFKTDNGQTVPVTAKNIENIESFDHPLIVAVLKKINDLNTPRTEAIEKSENGKVKDPKEKATSG